ncbi:MAG TPA: hypothetical protein VGL23_11740 [Chloroflexota bacterium]|jgi:hypothetical protein
MRHWRSRAVEVALPLEAARRMWGRAWRVDTQLCARLGTRRATVLLCAEAPGEPTCTPIGWCSMRWHLPTDATAVIDHLAWDDQAGATEDDAWRAIAALGGPPPPTAPPPDAGTRGG